VWLVMPFTLLSSWCAMYVLCARMFRLRSIFAAGSQFIAIPISLALRPRPDVNRVRRLIRVLYPGIVRRTTA
jgi:endonuclease/exonuclease/phosphatase (EEP) superfamily protein YafD